MLLREDIPPDPGTYILFLLLSKSDTISVGSLGVWNFQRGYYAYTGSARGPGGLGGRIRRHLRPQDEKRHHWHIDYLTSRAQITHVSWDNGDFNRECSWALQLAKLGSIPVPHFGSSDCGCPGHLICLPTLTNHPDHWQLLMKPLGNRLEIYQV